MDRSALASGPVARMLASLGRCAVTASSREPLKRLCSLGARYGWRALRETIGSKMLAGLSARARTRVRRHLGRTLESITRPCFELESTSRLLAAEALGRWSSKSEQTKQELLRARPVERLFSLFRRFPVLAELWSTAIDQWREQVAEILLRAATDEHALAREFFGTSTTGRIRDLRLGLSDRHLGGRTVACVEFEQGRVIYKPRSGTSEMEWASLVRWMNRHGFKPQLREVRIVRRKDYHWAEYVAANGCDNATAVRRFYQRLGGMIAAVYLLNAVDCHRGNLIASGEHPVLVDIDALWHVSPLSQSEKAVALLYRTGFFPNADPTSLQSRSSVFGKARTGPHTPSVRAHYESPAAYDDEIVDGFERAWHCLVGTTTRRAAFARRRRRIQSQERRCIHRASADYAAVIHASLQPAALISPAARHALIRRLAARSSASGETIEAEVEAMQRLDIPYFVQRTNERMTPIPAAPPTELGHAIRKALERRKLSRRRN